MIIVLKVASFHMQRGNQKLSKMAAGLIGIVLLTSAVCVCISLPHHQWLWLINIFKYV
jgi:hypothetical protein